MKNFLFTITLVTMIAASVFVFTGIYSLDMTVFLIGTHSTLAAIALYGLFISERWKEKYEEEVKRRRANMWANNEPGSFNGRSLRSRLPNGHLLIILVMVMSSCGSAFYHDSQNPCTPDQYYSNVEECEQWKTDYPKEYQRYINRTQRPKR